MKMQHSFNTDQKITFQKFEAKKEKNVEINILFSRSADIIDHLQYL